MKGNNSRLRRPGRGKGGAATCKIIEDSDWYGDNWCDDDWFDDDWCDEDGDEDCDEDCDEDSDAGPRAFRCPVFSRWCQCSNGHATAWGRDAWVFFEGFDVGVPVIF